VRRAPIVIVTTVAGASAVLSFHAHQPTIATTATAASPSTTTTTPSTAPGSSGSSGSSSGSSGTATGDAVSTRYGDAQVKVTVKDGKIVTVQALQLQGNDPRSVAISTSAEPVLQQEVLQAQSADVDAVSGATFTSASYEQSVQSALDKLGFKAADGSRATLQVPAGGFGH
jgi:uncharacterized protein with FMN-binding domain